MNIEALSGKESSDQYQNIFFHAKGGMGEIYKALDTTNNKEVAIKLIHIQDQEHKELLIREIDISSKISGSNIVNTNHTGEHSLNGSQYLYIVQDFYSNGNLRGLVKEGTALTECFRLMLGILNGLKTLHETIIHRDLKPENILIDAYGNPVITDFGLAKYIDEKTKTKTFKGGGTLPYMAPECWLMDKNSISMDIYALGILFYELITGKQPFSARNELDWRDCHLYKAMPDISSLRPETSVKLKQIISKMTQKRVEDRYKTVGEVILALNEAVQQNNQESKEFERLAALAHSTNEKIQTEKLKEKQKLESLEQHRKNLDYHVTELFDKIKVFVGSINLNLEVGKIIIDENRSYGGPASRNLMISFNTKRISIEFYSDNIINKYEKKRIEDSKNRQIQNRGFSFNSPEQSIFSKKSITFIGKVESNYVNGSLGQGFGYNLVLAKNPNEMYGKWFVASFSDTGFNGMSRKNFALDIIDFLREFPLCFVMHTLKVDYHELSDADLIRTIEELVR